MTLAQARLAAEHLVGNTISLGDENNPDLGLLGFKGKNTQAKVGHIFGKFKVVPCSVKGQDGIQLVTEKDKMLVRVGGQLFIRKLSFDNENTCFEVADSDKKTFRLKPITKKNHFIFINNNKKLKLKNKKNIGKKGYFFANVYEEQNILQVFKGKKFTGKTKYLTEGVANIKNKDLKEKDINSVIIYGSKSWHLFSKVDFKGQLTVLAPGSYDKSFIAPLKTKSFKVTGTYNNMELFTKESFKGESLELASSRSDLTFENITSEVKSLMVVGPEAWDVFSEVSYKGQTVRLEPGKYKKSVNQVSFNIASARRVNPYENLCDKAPGKTNVKVSDGSKINIKTVHKDGAVWLKFAKKGNWNFENEKKKNLKLNLLKKSDLEILKQMGITDFLVDSDIQMVVKTKKDSYHPSSIDVLRLGASESETFKFVKKSNDATTLTFSNDHMTIKCSGTDGDTLCGNEETLFPMANQDTGAMALLGVNLQPRGVGAFANGKWRRNAYTFKGSKYILYAKVTECPMNSLAGTNIPEYMENDMYTRNVTGCTCSFDISRKDCACCADNGCPCGGAYKFQCVRCGFEDKLCGRPSVLDNQYEFEVTDVTLSDTGMHYVIPEICVTSCKISVDALASSGTKVGAYMSDSVFNRRLSCIVETEGTNTNLTVTSYAESETGVPVDAVHLYGYGGSGFMNSLTLTVNDEKCPEKVDDRVMGCFVIDTSLIEHPFSSSHMTQQMCLNYCQGIHYKFAHLYKSDFCGCTNTMLPHGLGLGCDMSCSGDAHHACGGHFDALTFEMDVSDAGGYFAAPNGCASVGAVTANTRMAAKIKGSECKSLTGRGSGNKLTNCFMEWCRAPVVTPNGLYVSRPGSCGNRFVSKVNIRTTGYECLAFGGSPRFAPHKSGNCELDFCRADTKKDVVFEAVHAGGCKGNTKVGKGSLRTLGSACEAMGGGMKKFKPSKMVDCTFDWCVKEFKESMEDNVYTYPHEVAVPGGSTTKLHLPSAMCVSQIEATVANVDEANVAGKVSFFYEGLQVSKDIPAGGSGLVLGYTTDPSGTFTDTISISSEGASFTVNEFRIIIDRQGCVDHDDAIVLYDGQLFNGKRIVIREDTSDLDEFVNKASSFKILGDSLWQLHESINYHGKSAVLSNGEFPSTDVLPFEDNSLESVRRVPSRDQSRQDISNYYGHVCFERKTNMNAMYGLMNQIDGKKNMDYGIVHGDAVACETKCREDINCAAWTLTTDKFPEYPGHCFGRGFFDDVGANEEETVSGHVADCSKEDMLLVYSKPYFEGNLTVVIQNEFNITKYRPASLRITGRDVWILVTESATAINKMHLAPGEYPMMDFLVDPSLTMTELKKQNPSIQMYEQTSTAGLAELYPVVSNQIEQIFPGSTNTTCKNAQKAEVAFVTDSSASIGTDNYQKVLNFMEHIVDSFRVGIDAVRVATLLYDKYLHYDLELGQYNTKASVKAAIDNLKYYSGNTYTHKALKKTYTDILNDNNCREHVSRVAIVITDGESAWPEETVIEAKKAREEGINVIAVGVNNAVYEELVAIAGDQSQVFHVDSFDQLDELVDGITTATCTAVLHKETIENITEHEAITNPGNDEKYFKTEHFEFIHKAYPLGMESGVIYDQQISCSSELKLAPASGCRLNHEGGWQAAVQSSSFIEVDFGKILPVHGIGTQGNSLIEGWVTKYKVAISVDGINFNVLKANSTALIFTGNTDQDTVVHHCLHRIFGEVIYARVIRIIVIEWHITLTMRVEFYGFRNPDDAGLLEVLEQDVWTRNTTGCPCYFDHNRFDCACCEDGGCQCGMANRHQCVQCGYPHNCGTPNIRHPETNVDGWTMSMNGCPCEYNPFLNNCACCQSFGCQCGEKNKNQCVNCGHPEHCGLKEHIFGPNSYCYEKLCPKSNAD